MILRQMRGQERIERLGEVAGFSGELEEVDTTDFVPGIAAEVNPV